MCEASFFARVLGAALACAAFRESLASAEPAGIPTTPSFTAPTAAPVEPNPVPVAPTPGAAPAPSAAPAPAPTFTVNPQPAFTRPPFTVSPQPAFTRPPIAPPPSTASPQPAVTPSPIYYVPYPPPTPEIVPAPKPADARYDDANVDHVVLVPTAETHPAGTVYFSDYDVAFIQVGYAPGDRAEVTLSGIPPFGERNPIALVDLSVKGVIVRSDRFRLAALGSVTGLVGFEDSQDLLGRIGGAATLCFDDGCRSTANVAATALLAGPALLVLDGFGAVLRASRLVAVLLEVQSVLPASREGGEFHGAGGAVGVRLSGRSWGVDLAFDAFASRTGARLQPAPIFSFTYRILP